MLHRKYMPATLDDVVGQTKAVATMRRLLASGVGGRAIWISGKSGQGKTSLALIAAHAIADECCIEEYDGGELTASRVREIARLSSIRGLGTGGRCYIVNEAHGMRSDVVRALLIVLESLPKHVTWIFTTTDVGQAALFEDKIDASPLVSRCVAIELKPSGNDVETEFAARAKEVALAENLDDSPCLPIYRYVKMVRDCGYNLRMVLSRIEAGEMLA